LCKPNKTGGAPRWRDRELVALRRFERDPMHDWRNDDD
jgi:hypothetical protein